MKNLISMTDFVLTPMLTLVSKKVLDKLEPYQYHNYSHSANINYAKFLKQPLELWMFVPCDENGNVLEEPYNDGNGDNYFGALLDEYQQAKERCLFEGFECQKQGKEILVTFDKNPVWVSWNNSKIIENLVYLKPQLTQIAIKQLGL